MSQDAKQTVGKMPFLLEIGSEEIPARFIPDAMVELQRRSEAALGEAHLTWDGIRVVATPRRMALLVEGLSDRQPDRELEIKGPPVSVAFAADGSPTPAAQGFARKAGVDLDECERGSDRRGEFLLARRVEPGRPAAEVLAEILPAVVLAIPFRKVMRWGDRDLEYPRPLQWIAALLGADVVPLAVDYLQADRLTRGHRTLATDRTVEIAAADQYLETLRSIHVIVDHRERREMITAGVEKAVASFPAGARLLVDEELLTEVVHLCEHPTAFLGSFDDEFLVLPAEVISTALKAHQRYFSVGQPDGSGLVPRFAAVRDGGVDHLAQVVEGNERVLRARLADALFYWTFDQKKTPDERTRLLESVTWLEGFGSVLDKTRRVGELSGWLWHHGMASEADNLADLQRGAVLFKSDLTSEMIRDGKEFTKLEGFIGARYAELAGENDAVCTAIERHYLPRSATGELPGDRLSSVLSVADRLDNLAGCWLAGFVPTGAKDPYALRRHVLAVVRILLDLDVAVDLNAALAEALARLRSFAPDRNADEILSELGEFVRTRLTGYLVDSLGADPDVVRAVVPVRWRDPVDALAWANALSGYRDREDFQLLATGFKRCRNILRGEILPVDELEACLERWRDTAAVSKARSGLSEDQELKLLDTVAAAADELVTAEGSGDYDRVFAILSGFGPDIDGFFDAVRVNVEDEKLRAARHRFLREIHGLFARYADFTAVAPAE